MTTRVTTAVSGEHPLTGVVGAAWRAEVTPTGTIVPLDGTPPLSWYVAAEDRWHDPAQEPTLRQSRADGTAVYETRLRVPRGDLVARIWSVADRGGLTLVEFTNESPCAVAVALDRADLLTSRPPATVPIEGIDLPPSSIVLPLAHGTTVTVALSHDGPRSGALPSRWPSHADVVAGWTAQTATASRLDLPDEALVAAVTTARCDALLAGPDVDDPAAAALAIVELVRMGEPADAWVPDLVAAVEAAARGATWRDVVAVERAAIVFARAGERRAVRDAERLLAQHAGSAAPRPIEPVGIEIVPFVETMIASGPNLLPGGIPPEWRGHSFGAHDVPTGPSSCVSYAVRWHGDRPAVLWEQHGDTRTLRADAVDGDWTSDAQRGEALWARVGD